MFRLLLTYNCVIDKLYKRVYDNKEFTFTKEVDYEGCNL